MLAEGESLTVEFKSRTPKDAELARVVACMANGAGGTVLIGVDDDGTVIGARDLRGGSDGAALASFIQNRTEPPLPVTVRVEDHGDAKVVRIDVPRADPGPVGTKSGEFSKRALDANGRPQCVPMTPHEIVSVGMVARGQDYAAAPAAEADFEDLFTVGASVTELYVGIHRVDVPLIPTATRREAVANALVHRDYAQLGPTRVQVSDEEFLVANPGGLPPGVTVDNILDESRPRSRILAEAFRRAGFVERRGKGVNDMFEQQLRWGHDVPDYSRTTSDSVTVSVSLGASDLDVVRFLIGYENANQQSLSLSEMRVVHEVRAYGNVTTKELTETLSMLPGALRATAARLVEKGILEMRGSGRNRQYHLTARFFDIAEDRNAYVRVKGADPLQQQRMILDYVTAFGSIARGQAAELCQVSPPEARRVLKGLVDEGRLVLVGERRGARYVVPNS